MQTTFNILYQLSIEREPDPYIHPSIAKY